MHILIFPLATTLSVLLTCVDSQECSQKRPVISAKGLIRGEDIPTVLIMKPFTRLDTVYMVQGETLELFCSGRTNNLVISNLDARQTVEVLNATTVKLTEKPENEFSGYECTDVETGCRNSVSVIIHTLPEVSNFSCISKNLDFLICTWSTSGRIRNFSLSYVTEGRVIPICEGNVNLLNTCLWHSTSVTNYRPETRAFTFLMQICGVGCVNQTYEIDHYSIVKPHPPHDFRLYSKTSHSASFGWDIPDKMALYILNGLDHKLEYWSPGSEPQQVNISLPKGHWMHTATIHLPCASKYYEVRLSIRPKEAVGEQYWSEPATVRFYTETEKEEVSDPICYKEPGETLDNMLYEISKLRKSVRKEVLKLKDQINSLKLKAVGIKP